MRNDRPILLIEDNPDDEALTLRAFAKNGVLNPVTIVRDGGSAGMKQKLGLSSRKRLFLI